MKNKIYNYPHPEWFDGVPSPSKGELDNLVLWGAGKLGEVVAYVLEQQEIEFDVFVDSARDKWDKEYCGHKIISPEMFYSDYSDHVVVVSSAFPVILEDLRSRNIKSYDAHSFLLNVDFSDYKGVYTVEYLERCITYGLSHYALNRGTGVMLEKLFFVLTDKCSLRCLNCDGYIPYYTDPKSDSLELVKNCFRLLTDVCGNIEEINLLGGEPMVHKEIDEIVEFFVNSELCDRVVIISNGTIVPDERLKGLLKSSKCLFRLSDYGRYSNKKDELIKLFDENDIKYEITNYQHWERVPLIKRPDETLEELDKKYVACTSNQLYVKNGKIFHCNFLSGLSSFGNDLFPNMDSNYVDMFSHDEDSSKEKIRSYIDHLHSRRHLDACKYCPGSHCMQFEEKLPVAEQTTETLPIDQLYREGKRL